MKGKPYIVRILLGLLGPKIKRPGRDVAGQVEAVGRNVTQFKPSDEVFGTCRGALAEYVCTSESAVVMKPDNVSPFLRRGDVRMGSALILGRDHTGSTRAEKGLVHTKLGIWIFL